MAVRVTDFINLVSFRKGYTYKRLSDARIGFVSYAADVSSRGGNSDIIMGLKSYSGSNENENNKKSDAWVALGANNNPDLTSKRWKQIEEELILGKNI